MKNKISLTNGSDKQYWHRFLPFYDHELELLKRNKSVKNILEFGVFKGDSVRWINEKFPDTNIFACDILPIQPEWPVSKNINYLYVDQGNIKSIQNVFLKIEKNLDLIIEDGSHFPEHQRNCLLLGLKNISSGGMYILEDLHTSHPDHVLYNDTIKNNSSLWGKILNSFFNNNSFCLKNYTPYKIVKTNKFIGPLHLLLCLEHYKVLGRELDKDILNDLSKKSLFNSNEILEIFNKIKDIKIYKRSMLPHKCYNCGSIDFNYHELKCKCGLDIYSHTDSMVAVINVI